MPEIVYRTKEFEYTHRWDLLGIETDVRFLLSYQESFSYPELTFVKLRLMDLKPPIGFDILIFDREHIIIAFTPLADVKVVQTALLFENQPQIASEFADWFDQIISRSASNPS